MGNDRTDAFVCRHISIWQPAHPWSDHVRSMVSGTVLYSFQSDRILLGRETSSPLRVSSSIRTGDLSEFQLRHLAGEAMAVPSVTLVMLSLLSILPDLWSGEQIAL